DTGSTGVTAIIGEWRHVDCTFDGRVSRIYVNGRLANSLTLHPSEAALLERNTAMPFRISGTPFNGLLRLDDYPWPSAVGVTGNRGFDGRVDEVAYYAYALSSNTIAAHYDAAKPTGGTNTAGYHAQILADNPVGYGGFDEAAPTPPNPASLPIAANSGILGSPGERTN